MTLNSNTPEHQAAIGHAIFTALSSGLRPLVAALNAEYRQSSGHLIRIARHVSSLRSLPSQLLAEHVARGSVSPPLPLAFHQSRQDSRADVSKNFPIRIQVSGRRTAIRVGRFTQVQPKSISDYLRFLSWLVAPVDLLGNHTRGVTQSVGAIDRKRGIFTQDKNTGAGGVRRRQSRNLARPGDWLQGR